MNNKNFLEILKDEFRKKFNLFFEKKVMVDMDLNPFLEDLENLKYLFEDSFLNNENLKREHFEIKKIIAEEIVTKLLQIENTRYTQYFKYLATQESKNRGSQSVNLLKQDLGKIEEFEKLLKEYVEPSIFFERQEISFDKKIKDVFEVIDLIKNDLKTMNEKTQTRYISWEHYYTTGKTIDIEKIRENSEAKAKENELIEYYKSICIKYKIKIKLANLNSSLKSLKIETYKRIKENLK